MKTIKIIFAEGGVRLFQKSWVFFTYSLSRPQVPWIRHRWAWNGFRRLCSRRVPPAADTPGQRAASPANHFISWSRHFTKLEASRREEEGTLYLYGTGRTSLIRVTFLGLWRIRIHWSGLFFFLQIQRLSKISSCELTDVGMEWILLLPFYGKV